MHICTHINAYIYRTEWIVQQTKKVKKTLKKRILIKQHSTGWNENGANFSLDRYRVII